MPEIVIRRIKSAIQWKRVVKRDCRSRFTAGGGGEQFHNSRVLKNSFTFHLHNSLFTDLSRYFKQTRSYFFNMYNPPICIHL